MLQDILVTGLVNGGVYALLAIGFSLIFGVARIVNIAHTAFYMLAAYCFYALLVKVGLGLVASGVIAVAAVTALSVLCYRLVIEPVREHEAAVLIAKPRIAAICGAVPVVPEPVPSAAAANTRPSQLRARTLNSFIT